MNHFVVLKGVSKNSFTVHYPALSEHTCGREEFSQHSTGVALELTPTEKFEKRMELWGRMFGLKHNLMQVFVLASPFYLQVPVDEVLTMFDTDRLLVLALGFTGFTAINFISQTIRGYVLLYFGSMMSYPMVDNLFRHLIKLPISSSPSTFSRNVISVTLFRALARSSQSRRCSPGG